MGICCAPPDQRPAERRKILITVGAISGKEQTARGVEQLSPYVP